MYYVQYAHARTSNVRRNAAGVGIGLDEFDPNLLDHPADTALLGALGEFPRIVSSAAELRARTGVARYLESLAATYHRWYDTTSAASCRRGRPHHDSQSHSLVAERSDSHRARQRIAAARRERSGASVNGLRIARSDDEPGLRTPAGPRHADSRRNRILPGARRRI